MYGVFWQKNLAQVRWWLHSAATYGAIGAESLQSVHRAKRGSRSNMKGGKMRPSFCSEQSLAGDGQPCAQRKSTALLEGGVCAEKHTAGHLQVSEYC